jgi:hypothetical protein
MNKLKEINGKYYQECEVVMLATDKITGIIKFGNQLRTTPQGLSNMVYYSQHLYFLSNEEIKKGDWCIVTKSHKDLLKGDIFQYNGNHSIDSYNVKKIIVTTDTSLRIGGGTGRREDGVSISLPQPSKSFIQAYIKAYNENKPIIKVLVEMEGIGGKMINDKLVPIAFKSKINSSNEITIKKIKDSYTREEYFKGLKHAIERAVQYPELFITGICCDKHKINNWIEHNL